jgi:hypothetical protein
MDNFPDNLFPFLMVAIVLGVRVILTLRRRNRGRQGKSSVPTAAPKPARGFVPWEDEFREDAPVKDTPVQTVAADEDEAFSAWDLSVNDDSPAPAVSPGPPEPPSPVPIAAVSARFVAERLTPVPNRAEAVPERLAAAPERLTAAPARLPRPVSKSSAQRFRTLLPLQRAVVWAEILGAPKGFQD